MYNNMPYITQMLKLIKRQILNKTETNRLFYIKLVVNIAAVHKLARVNNISETTLNNVCTITKIRVTEKKLHWLQVHYFNGHIFNFNNARKGETSKKIFFLKWFRFNQF